MSKPQPTNQNKGKLLIPSCKLTNEQEGVYNLFKGSIAFFKNPSSHRTVNHEDRLNTIEILTLADLLLLDTVNSPIQNLKRALEADDIEIAFLPPHASLLSLKKALASSN